LSRQIAIKNGYVYDPANRIDGDKMDIFVRNGKMIQKISGDFEQIDASGMIVMAGGVDIHNLS